MPTCGDRNVPCFDSAKPCELTLFFSDLEYHFTRLQMTDGQDKKIHSRCYVDCDTSDLWESLPEHDATVTYDDYKAAIRRLYPGADSEHKWTVADLTSLTAEYARGGITCLDMFGDYHRQFLIISRFLIAKGRLLLDKQSRSFVTGFSPTLWPHVSQRLQLKFLDHNPNDHFQLQDIEEAACYILHGTCQNGLFLFSFMYQ